MKCEQFDLFLKEKVPEKDFLKHLDSCPQCIIKFEADQRLMGAAKELNKNIEIPNNWSAIKPYLPAIKNQKGYPIKSRRTLTFSLAASILVITAFFLLQYSPKSSKTSNILTRQALVEVRKTEAAYLSAINHLEDLAGDKMSATPEPLAQLYKNKLQLINQQINRCQSALQKNPANAHLRKYLLAVLQEKKKTLSQIIDNKI